MLASLQASEPATTVVRLVKNGHLPGRRKAKRFEASSDARDAVVMGEYEERIPSTRPLWFQEWITAGFEEGEIAAALAAIAAGTSPNERRRESRAILARIEAARVTGDADAWIAPQNGRRDGIGGGRRGVTQAAPRVDGGNVSRFPLRINSATLESLRAEAARRGVTLNAHISAILADVASRGADPESEPF